MVRTCGTLESVLWLLHRRCTPLLGGRRGSVGPGVSDLRRLRLFRRVHLGCGVSLARLFPWPPLASRLGAGSRVPHRSSDRGRRDGGDLSGYPMVAEETHWTCVAASKKSASALPRQRGAQAATRNRSP